MVSEGGSFGPKGWGRCGHPPKQWSVLDILTFLLYGETFAFDRNDLVVSVADELLWFRFWHHWLKLFLVLIDVQIGIAVERGFICNGLFLRVK